MGSHSNLYVEYPIVYYICIFLDMWFISVSITRLNTILAADVLVVRTHTS